MIHPLIRVTSLQVATVVAFILVAFTGMLQVKGNPQGTGTTTAPTAMVNDTVSRKIFGEEVGAVAVKLMEALGTDYELIKKKTISERATGIYNAITLTSNMASNVVWYVATTGFYHAAHSSSEKMPYIAYVSVAILTPLSEEYILAPNAPYYDQCHEIFNDFFKVWESTLSAQKNSPFVNTVNGIRNKFTAGLKKNYRIPVGKKDEFVLFIHDIIADLKKCNNAPDAPDDKVPHPELNAWQVVGYLLTHRIGDLEHLDVINKALENIKQLTVNQPLI